jgi:hypothetical protein
MGRLEDIEKRNRKGLAVLGAIEGATSIATGQPVDVGSPREDKIPSQRFSRNFGILLVIAFFVLVTLTIIFR